MNNEGLGKIKEAIDNLALNLKSGTLEVQDTISELQAISEQIDNVIHECELKLNRIVRMLHE